MLKTLNDFIAEIDSDDTIGNDDEITALYDQIRLRDDAILELYGALEEHYADSSAGSLTRMTINRYNEFVNGVYHQEDEEDDNNENS